MNFIYIHLRNSYDLPLKYSRPLCTQIFSACFLHAQSFRMVPLQVLHNSALHSCSLEGFLWFCLTYIVVKIWLVTHFKPHSTLPCYLWLLCQLSTYACATWNMLYQPSFIKGACSSGVWVSSLLLWMVPLTKYIWKSLVKGDSTYKIFLKLLLSRYPERSSSMCLI